jgi:hypothetical protein
MPDQFSKRDGDQHEHVAVDRAPTDYVGFWLKAPSGICKHLRLNDQI